MSRPLVRGALVTAGCALSVLAPAGAASAQRIAVADAAGDVWRTTDDIEAQESVVTAAGSPVNVDLLRTVVRHGTTRVVVTFGYAELDRGVNPFAVRALLRTDEGVRREVGVQIADAQAWGGERYFGGRRGSLSCKGLTHAIDYAADTVTVAVPRTCLSGPRWVQARIDAMGFDTSTEEFATFGDNGHDASAHPASVWSARVRRG